MAKVKALPGDPKIGKHPIYPSIEYPGREVHDRKVGKAPEQKEWHNRKREPVG